MNEKLIVYVFGTIFAISLLGTGWFANYFVESITDPIDSITDGERIAYLESEIMNDYCRIVLNNEVNNQIEVNCNNFRLNHGSFENWCSEWDSHYLGYQGSIEKCWIDFEGIFLQENQ